MDSYVVASIVFACVFTGSLLGLCLNVWLPEHHRSAASHDAIKLGTGMISVLASLVLGLLTASIKNSFDTTDGQMRTFAANLILLDQTLRDYGPDTAPARKLVRAS
jgi:fluoride ion exporter CrcB/FEX